MIEKTWIVCYADSKKGVMLFDSREEAEDFIASRWFVHVHPDRRDYHLIFGELHEVPEFKIDAIIKKKY